MTLEVIGAGWGRTATNSMKLALEQLGYGTCHHMWEVAHNQVRLMPLWNDALDGPPDQTHNDFTGWVRAGRCRCVMSGLGVSTSRVAA